MTRVPVPGTDPSLSSPDYNLHLSLYDGPFTFRYQGYMGPYQCIMTTYESTPFVFLELLVNLNGVWSASFRISTLVHTHNLYTSVRVIRTICFPIIQTSGG